MCTINLRDIIVHRPLPEAGSRLLDMMMSKLNAGESIILDMDGVPSLPSIFLNMSIGKFIEEHGVELLKQKVTFSKISKGQAARLQEYIQKFGQR